MLETMALIALGSNRPHHRHGPPRAVLQAAVAALQAHGVVVTAVSRIYRTAPVGPPQPVYANAAIRISTGLELAALRQLMVAVEQQLGRKRQRRWAARVIDLDLIAFGPLVHPHRLAWRAGRGFLVPHRRAHERAFVLAPLCDVEPHWRHPLLGRSIRQLAARRGAGKAVRPYGRLRQP